MIKTAKPRKLCRTLYGFYNFFEMLTISYLAFSEKVQQAGIEYNQHLPNIKELPKANAAANCTGNHVWT